MKIGNIIWLIWEIGVTVFTGVLSFLLKDTAPTVGGVLAATSVFLFFSRSLNENMVIFQSD